MTLSKHMTVGTTWVALGGSMGVGTLGGLIGLGGAEFRLPFLMGVFSLPPLKAIILNKALSLVVVSSALPFRSGAVPFSSVIGAWPILVNLLAGTLLGAWVGASGATRLPSRTLRHIIAGLLVGLAAVLLLSSRTETISLHLTDVTQVLAGIFAGFGIGCVASLLGVAGGELLIPTLVILFGADMHLAGSLSLAISLPTMVVGFVRYSYDQSFAVLQNCRALLSIMAIGSVAGTLLGGQLLGIVPRGLLGPLLAGILVISAVKLWHDRGKPRPVTLMEDRHV